MGKTLRFSSYLLAFLFVIYSSNLHCAEPERPKFYLGPEDVLEISVWNNEDLEKQVTVRPDGKISFPLIGDILAQGLGVEELRQAIEDKISVLVPDMPVTVVVTHIGSQNIYVVGEVAKPGVYMLGKTLRVIQVLGMAGGITPYAKRKKIIILRMNNDHQELYFFNYNEVAEGRNLDQNILLQSGDTIIVP